MKARTTQSLRVLAAVVTLAACGDRAPTTPAAQGDQSATFAKTGRAPRGDDHIVHILTRVVRLRSDLTVSGVIGPAGGRLAIPGAGLEIAVPPHALARATRITITATRGAGVAYEFQPHGLVFGASVLVRQDLNGTIAAHNPAFTATLQGSYFDTDLANAFVDSTQDLVRVKERRPARFHSIKDVLEFSIEHFSGYMVSTGFAGTSVEFRAD